MALCEFRCPSLDYVNRMSWAEFMIRLHGYQREQKREMMRVRELAWVTYMAPHQNPKRMKRSIDAFWPLKKGKKELSQKQQDAIRRAQEQYLEDLKKKENG